VLNIFPKLSETFIAGELAELRRRGVELRVLSMQPPKDALRHDIISRAGLDEITSYDVRSFTKIVTEFRPDMLHAHFAREATEKARALSDECGLPFCFTAHGYDIHRKPPEDFYDRALAAGAVITVSEANATYISETFKVNRSHIHVIPCGVDTERFCPPSAPPKLAEPPLLVAVARHVEVKNLGLLLQACALLRDHAVGFRCVIVGDGPLNAALKAQRARLGLETLVEMPGAASQDQVVRLWQRASLGVLTSHNEGMPVCLMEAAACGVPVVATSVGGVPELVEQGVTGLLCPPGHTQALAGALEHLIGDAARREKMGSAARVRAEQRFSVVRQVDSLQEVWSQVLKE
jgi:glycosyltransferase involved in cell wall biosynthesis